MFGRRVDRAAGADLMAGDRRDVDDVPGFLLFMYGSAAAMP